MSTPFLRIPPFPGSRAQALAFPSQGQAARESDAATLAALLAQARVGGTFWAAQPALPQGRDIVLAPESRAQAQFLLAEAASQGLDHRVVLLGPWPSRGGVPVLPQPCDPWHIAAQASAVHTGAGHELALVAALCGKAVRTTGEGRFAALDRGGDIQAGLLACIARELLLDFAFHDPFTGQPMAAADAIARLAEWRRLIDANRQAAAICGVAHWKRVTADAMLWDGSGPVRHASARSRRARALRAVDKALAWKARTPPALLEKLTTRGIALGEIEDGMIRSAGLGANCVPPLSIIVDFHGAHFDPAQPSELEQILQNEEIPAELAARAATLRKRLVRAGVGKYGVGGGELPRPDDARRRVLVTGQVGDDRAVLCNGAGLNNAELLRQARLREPDAWIIYKPHPDVEAGHRKGFVPDAEILRHADEIERKAPIMSLIGSVDAVHVISSQAGFEALMHDKEVTTHGVPFYAGWGLTQDLGPVPPRRNRQRTLDELVAATLILYPRYLDPITRLPCPVEVLVERLAAGKAQVASPLVRLREAQGQWNLFIKRVTHLCG